MGTYDEIREYYEQCNFDYQFLWGTDQHHGFHMGYHDGYWDGHENAIEQMRERLMAAGGIGSEDYVLDAGCGTGGCAVVLARELGVRVHGVNISPFQLDRARTYAESYDVSDRVSFSLSDFTNLPIERDAMDVVWGLESISHSDQKRTFIEEADRVLSPDGRIVISDGFMHAPEEELSSRDRREMAHWLDGWAVPPLMDIVEFCDLLRERGFTVTARDLTEKVYPSSLWLSLASVPLYVFGLFLKWWGARTAVQMGNIVAAYYQHLTLRRDLWGYWHVIAER